MNFHNHNTLSLHAIRQELIRLEDSIIFALIERAQFAHNVHVYTTFAQSPTSLDKNESFLEKMLYEIECVHARYRRYTSPDEYPFSTTLPNPILEPMSFPALLHKNTVDVNGKIKRDYVTEILPLITRGNEKQDDGNYGSSATRDIEVLQLLSRRIHFGKFVAEAKFTDPSCHDKYVTLIQKEDKDGLMNLLTDEKVEEKLLKRVRKKAGIYGQDINDSDDEHNGGLQLKIPLDIVADIFKNYIIPRTKQVQVEYLLQRLA